MKLTKFGDASVATSEGFKTMSFGIDDKNIGLILETLRSKMYSNPIAAVCREISSNCRDSHRESGKPNEPIEIAIKDGDVFMGISEDVSSTINFIDRGVGISPERISNIYLLFGASTKRSDNSQTGGFGYGAKTPFAYSDSFAVITVHEKKKYTYFFSIGEDRRGDAYLIAEEDTNQGNGTTVSIPLKEEDKQKFEYELMRATYFWDVLPKFSGGFTESFKHTMNNRDRSIVFKKDKFFMTNGNTPSAFRIFGFIIDGIYYDYTTTKELEAFKNLVERTIKNGRLYLRFGTGEVSISTNRESLFYDKKTIELILNNSKQYVSTLKKEYIAGIKKFDRKYYEFCYQMTQAGRYGSGNQTEEMQKTADIYRTLLGFEKKFIVKCNKKYFGITFDPNNRRDYGSSQEENFINAVDRVVEFQGFEKFVSGDKRGRRTTNKFSNLRRNLIEDNAPIYVHNNFLERDSIKKNLTIFAQGSKWYGHHQYWVMQIPKLDASFMAKAKADFRTKTEELKKKKDALDPQYYRYASDLSNLKSEFSNLKDNYKAQLHRRAVLQRILSEIPLMRKTPIPTYDAIPETKISRKASDLAKNSYRAVVLSLGLNRRTGNGTVAVRSYEPHGEYREVKLSEQDNAIILPTKSNNVYQIQQEVRQHIIETSYIEKLGLLYARMFPKVTTLNIVFAKANDYEFMKSINNTQRNVYRIEDFMTQATKDFSKEKIDKLFTEYQNLQILASCQPSEYDELNKFCRNNKSLLHPKIIVQMNFEKRIKRLREKALQGSMHVLSIFDKDYEDRKARIDAIATPITGVSELFAKDKVFAALVQLFRDSYKKICIPIQARRNLVQVFRRHYGAFIESLISNHYRERSYSNRDEKILRIGIKKLIRECDEKYESFSKKV